MENDLQQQFNAHWRQLGVDATQPFLVAVSGGIDSVVLCHLCQGAGLRFSLVHCNFGLRGEESNRDEAFVKNLANQLDVHLKVAHFDTAAFAKENKLSVQEAARNLRYSWFEAIRQEQNASYILLAHHANDNIETVLMHFFRGSGLAGLTGMPAFTQHGARCLRPLLPFTRKEIETFARHLGLQWVEDSSNSSDKYTRNFFRNTLIPQLQQVYPAVEANLLQNMQRLQKTEALYKQLVQKEKQTFLKKDGASYKVAVNKLLQYRHTSLLYEVLTDFCFTEGSVPELLKLAHSDSGRYMQNENWRIIRHRAWLLFTPRQAKDLQTFLVEKNEKTVYLPDARLELAWVEAKHFTLTKKPHLAQLDAREVSFPMVVRRWQAGDYFYPLGMPKKKKLSRFFIDQKLSVADKEKIWVVESGKKIIWVAGHRIDDRFKVMPHTKQVLLLSMQGIS